MLRYIGQILAMFAMVASAINAQCALYCSLRMAPSSAAYSASGAPSSDSGHSCCPEREAPLTDTQNRRQHPCADPLPTVVGDIAPASQPLDAPQCLDSEFRPSSDPSLRVQRFPPLLVVDSSGIFAFPAFSVLRI